MDEPHYTPGRLSHTPNSRSSAMPIEQMVPSSNSRPQIVNPWGVPLS